MARGNTFLGPFPNCPGGTFIENGSEEGAVILTFANSDQLFLETLPSSFTCFDFSININAQLIEYLVVGGTGEYENATGSMAERNKTLLVVVCLRPDMGLFDSDRLTYGLRRTTTPTFWIHKREYIRDFFRNETPKKNQKPPSKLLLLAPNCAVFTMEKTQ